MSNIMCVIGIDNGEAGEAKVHSHMLFKKIVLHIITRNYCNENDVKCQ